MAVTDEELPPLSDDLVCETLERARDRRAAAVYRVLGVDHQLLF